MSQSCEKHTKLPVVGQSPCAGCEIERLKEEVERLEDRSFQMNKSWAEERKLTIELRSERDQIRDEVERYRKYGCDTCDGSGHLHRADGEYFGACTSCGAYELEQARREAEGLRKDAERYRWIRSDLSAGKSDFCIMRKHWGADSLSAVVCLEDADMQIDAAMSKDPLANPGQ